MKQSKHYINWDRLRHVHAVLLVWFLLFFGSLHISPYLAAALAIGNALFMFVNIPLSLLSFVLMAKGRFSRKYNIPIAVLSVLNTGVSIAVWSFALSMAESAEKMSQMG